MLRTLVVLLAIPAVLLFTALKRFWRWIRRDG